MFKIFWISLVVITLLSGCSGDAPVDCEKEGPVVNLDQVVDATNCSTNDGIVQVTVSNGSEPYLFFLNGLAVEKTQLNNLKAGTYFITVTDANNCSASLDNITVLASDFSYSNTLEPNTSCLSGNGSIVIDVGSNNPPYTYKLGNGDFITENFFSGLTSGTHALAVKDNNGCIVDLSVTIGKGFTGISWTNDIKPLLTARCATSGCHNGVSRSNDFRVYTSAKSNAKSIKSKTQDRSMPFDGSLTQSEIKMIACWVDDGAFEN